jgi:hypothetical protein
MKTFTNYTQGTRGIRTKSGMIYIDPGQSEKIDADEIVGEVPDLGKKSDAADEAADDELAALRERVAELGVENDQLRAQIAAFDGDGNGKAGGSKPQDAKPAKG